MASRSSNPRNQLEEPFWRTPAAKILIITALIVGTLLGIRKLEHINARHQIEKRLNQDPALGPMVAKWKQTIASFANSPTPLSDAETPAALYFGEVIEFIETKPKVSSLAPTRLLKLRAAQLLAGTPGKYDKPDKIEISYKRFATGLNKPKTGEQWLVVVFRDSTDNNVVLNAYRYQP